jgi:uroporphyrinogen decarboxylase
MHDMAWSIRGFENALMDAMAEPDFYQELIDRLTGLMLAMVESCAGVPADAIMTGDDWGTQNGVLLGPGLWRKFIKPAWARVYAAIHAQGKLVISHCCGSIAEILPDVIEIGLDALQSVQPEARGMDPYELKRRFGSKITFWGGLGSQRMIPFGTPQQIRMEINRLRTRMSRGGGYILGPAKGFQPGTPLENAVAVIEGFLEQERSW